MSISHSLIRSLCPAVTLACSLSHSLLLILGGRYGEGRSRDLKRLLPFLL